MSIHLKPFTLATIPGLASARMRTVSTQTRLPMSNRALRDKVIQHIFNKKAFSGSYHYYIDLSSTEREMIITLKNGGGQPEVIFRTSHHSNQWMCDGPWHEVRCYLHNTTHKLQCLHSLPEILLQFTKPDWMAHKSEICISGQRVRCISFFQVERTSGQWLHQIGRTRY